MPRGYVPILELGRGGMGDVLLAVATGPGGINKLHVVKRLRDELAQNADFLAMFFNEARIAARIDHPNVVQTYEVGFDGECYFSTMEYLEGQSLEAFFTRGIDSVPTEIFLAVLCDALAGLHHAHELKDFEGRPLRVVHRDVSPQNIFVTYEGQAKLLDFGIAKAADSVSATRTGAVKGKMAYMPPEQVERNEKFDRRADVFAVGAILWRIITGQRLWKGLSDIEIYMHLTEKGVPSPLSLRPEAPPELVAICERALAFDADRRYPTAQALQEAIEAYLGHAGARVMPRQVGAAVADLFAEERAQVSASIAARFSQGTLIEEAHGAAPPMMPAFGVPLDSEGKMISAEPFEPDTSIMSREQVLEIRSAGRPTARIGPHLPAPRAPLSTDVTAKVAMLTDAGAAALLAADVEWPADSDPRLRAAPPKAPPTEAAWPGDDDGSPNDDAATIEADWPAGAMPSAVWPPRATNGAVQSASDAAVRLLPAPIVPIASPSPFDPSAQDEPAWPSPEQGSEAARQADQAAPGLLPLVSSVGQGAPVMGDVGASWPGGVPMMPWPAGGALSTGHHASAATSSAQQAAVLPTLSVDEATKALSVLSSEGASRALSGWLKGSTDNWVRAIALPALAAFALAALVLVAKGLGLFSSESEPSSEPAHLASQATNAGPFVLRVVPTPPDARVVVDEHPLELHTASYPKGEARHRVVVEAPGYQPYTDSITLREPKTTLRVTLKPKPAAAEVVREEGPSLGATQAKAWATAASFERCCKPGASAGLFETCRPSFDPTGANRWSPAQAGLAASFKRRCRSPGFSLGGAPPAFQRNAFSGLGGAPLRPAHPLSSTSSPRTSRGKSP